MQMSYSCSLMQEVIVQNSVKKPANTVAKKESSESSSEDESDSSSDDDVRGLYLLGHIICEFICFPKFCLCNDLECHFDVSYFRFHIC